MLKTKILILLFLTLLLTACEIEPTVTEINSTGREVSYLEVYKACDDHVICYVHNYDRGTGMHCFRDLDLVNRYCR